MSAPTRTTVLWVPDWTVVAAVAATGTPAHLPAAVHDGRRVVATSALARAQGVRRGMRRRQAQGCCPELVLIAADETRDAVGFEPVAAAAQTVVAGVEVTRAGLLLLPAGGATRYHGSEQALAVALVDAVAAGTGYECSVGTADGLLAAVLAARTGALVGPGESAAFLAPFGVSELAAATVDAEQARAVAALVDLLHRLGVRTLGTLAALPAPAVHARFGRTGSWAHTLALGHDLRPPARRRPAPDLEVTTVLDPPAGRVDTATFAGRRLAEQLHALLVERGSACGRLEVAARTDAGVELSRVWRTDAGWGGLKPARITDRVRWQLEGWLSGAAPAGGTDGERPVTLVALRLTALDVIPAGAEQGGLWGTPSGADLRATRALERVQGLLGGDAVVVAAVQGGRDVREQVHLQPFGQAQPPARRSDLPWPGRLPDPPPSLVPLRPVPVVLHDLLGAAVRLDPDGGLSAAPARLAGPTPAAASEPPSPSDQGHRVLGWAGPWLTMPRWWTDPGGHPRPTARLQLRLDDERALLLAGDGDRWWQEGEYE